METAIRPIPGRSSWDERGRALRKARGEKYPCSRGQPNVRLGIMQPYFLPYLGYWQLMKAVDRYIVYDDVAYIKGGWINRNNLLIAGQKNLFTISLIGPSSFKAINEINIGDDFSKLIKTIEQNYGRAPYYRQTRNLVEKMLGFESRNLAEFIINSFRIVLDYLNIKTELSVSSSLRLGLGLKGKARIFAMCETLGADHYYNAIDGQALYDRSEFASRRIALKFLKTNFTSYKQFSNDFIPGLSILDVLMFNSPSSVNEMLDDYELV
jgi:WbqC-like protein family